MKINNYQSYKISPKAKYALKRYKRTFRVKSKDSYVDDILLDLELTKDKKGNIIDTRFPQEIQNDIRAFLREKKVMYTDTGYLSLRAACYDLKTKDRIELCRRISYKFNKDINIEKRLKKAGGFFETNKKALAGIGGGIVLGTAGGLLLNYKKPDFVPGLLGKAVEKSGVGGTGLFGINGNLVKLAETGSTELVVPIEIMEKSKYTLSTNLVAGALGGIAAGVLTAGGIAVYRIIKNGLKRSVNNSDYEKIDALDSKLYRADNEKEGEILTELVNRSKNREVAVARAM